VGDGSRKQDSFATLGPTPESGEACGLSVPLASSANLSAPPAVPVRGAGAGGALSCSRFPARHNYYKRHRIISIFGMGVLMFYKMATLARTPPRIVARPENPSTRADPNLRCPPTAAAAAAAASGPAAGAAAVPAAACRGPTPGSGGERPSERGVASGLRDGAGSSAPQAFARSVPDDAMRCAARGGRLPGKCCSVQSPCGARRPTRASSAGTRQAGRALKRPLVGRRKVGMGAGSDSALFRLAGLGEPCSRTLKTVHAWRGGRAATGGAPPAVAGLAGVGGVTLHTWNHRLS
jgi:hypothetical protein